MTDVFVKQYLAEEETMFYVRYQNGWPVQQIEVSPRGKVLLDERSPKAGNSGLADQPLENADLSPEDYITPEEFYEVWQGRSGNQPACNPGTRPLFMT